MDEIAGDHVNGVAVDDGYTWQTALCLGGGIGHVAGTERVPGEAAGGAASGGGDGGICTGLYAAGCGAGSTVTRRRGAARQ